MVQYDVAIVGLGALGSAAAYYAAKKGAKVIAFEQFELGHVRGASHDTSRIVRTSYEYSEYVALARSAYKDWAEIETTIGQRLLTITGGVVFYPKNRMPPASEWAKGLEENKRWPQFDIKEDYDVIYTPDTGIAHAWKSVAALQSLARAHGAELRERVKVERVTPHDSGASGVTVDTSDGPVQASKVVLAADAWVNELLAPLGLHIPLVVTQEQVTYFKPTEPRAFESDRFPVWIWIGEQWYYGFPCFGEPSIKCAHDNAKNYMSPLERTFVHSPKIVEELTAAMQYMMPDPGRQELRTVTCQYTMTPDRQFIITPLERYEDIIVTMGAAHAFKFAPAIGRVAAELAIHGETQEDIASFVFPTPESIANPLRSKIAG